MTIKTFLLSCCFHILLFTLLALPEIVGADDDKALTYAEPFVTVCEPNSPLQFCDYNSTHPYCARLSNGRYYEYYGRVAQMPYNSNELLK